VCCKLSCHSSSQQEAEGWQEHTFCRAAAAAAAAAAAVLVVCHLLAGIEEEEQQPEVDAHGNKFESIAELMAQEKAARAARRGGGPEILEEEVSNPNRLFDVNFPVTAAAAAAVAAGEGSMCKSGVKSLSSR
jgi:hypothetical protein